MRPIGGAQWTDIDNGQEIIMSAAISLGSLIIPYFRAILGVFRRVTGLYGRCGTVSVRFELDIYV